MWGLFTTCTTCKKKIWIFQHKIESASYNQDLTEKTWNGTYHFTKECYPEYDIFVKMLKADKKSNKKPQIDVEALKEFIRKRGEIIDP